MKQAYLDGLFNLRGKVAFGLSPMRRLLSQLGHPEKQLKIVHFAGSNGKGSTLVTLEALLIASGYQVASFVSPHLVRFNERFRLNGQDASDEGVEAVLTQVCSALGIQLSDLEQAHKKDLPASFFELSFAMALLIGQGSDWMLVETGLGGRLDATNAVDSPVACVITKIGMDHMNYLGTSIESITKEKLGIFKPGAAVILAPQKEVVTQLAKAKAQEMGLEVAEVIPDFKPMTLGLKGEHQQENAATACLAYQKLCPKQRQLSEVRLAHCLSQVKWPGRLEQVEEGLWVDGAHNLDGLYALLSYLSAHYGKQKILLGLGWMQGKNLVEGFEDFGLNLTFLPLKGTFVYAEPNPAQALKDLGPILQTRWITGAYQDWQAGLYSEYDLVVVAGSLYLVGELKTLISGSLIAKQAEL